jgi:peptidyl-prolyl cis-trans isomerase SurA
MTKISRILRLTAAAALAFALPVGASAQDSTSQFPVERIAAIAGKEVVLTTEVEEKLAQYAQELAARGQRLPTDSASLAKFRLQMLDRMINDALMVQRAEELNIEVPDDELTGVVSRRMQAIQNNIGSEAAFREELKRVGFASAEEFRRRLMDQERRSLLQQRLLSRLREDGKLPPVPVTDADIVAYFEENKDQLPRIPATVSFRQIVVAAKPTPVARLAALSKAESLLVEIRGGADFEAVARRASMDETTREQGGDLGWHRRDGYFVPEFEAMMAAIPVGRVSPVFETTYGFHIIRVDRIQGSEYRVRQILISPVIDPSAFETARQLADSVATKWETGASFDSLANLYHDPDEHRTLPEYFRDSLPASYRDAFEGVPEGGITRPFELDDPRRKAKKYAVAQITRRVEPHVATLQDMREILRRELEQERAILRLLRRLRNEMYVRIML